MVFDTHSGVKALPRNLVWRLKPLFYYSKICGRATKNRY